MKSNSKQNLNPYSCINAYNNPVELPSAPISAPNSNQMFSQPLVSLAEQQSSTQADGNKISERERRLKLREIERKNRMKGINNQSYGQPDTIIQNEENNKENFSSKYNIEQNPLSNIEKATPTASIYDREDAHENNPVQLSIEQRNQMYSENPIDQKFMSVNNGETFEANMRPINEKPEEKNIHTPTANPIYTSERDKKEMQKQEMMEEYQKAMREKQKSANKYTESTAKLQQNTEAMQNQNALNYRDAEKKKKEQYAQELMQQIMAKKPPTIPKQDIPPQSANTYDNRMSNFKADEDKKKKDDYRAALLSQMKEKSDKRTKVEEPQPMRESNDVNPLPLPSRPQSHSNFFAKSQIEDEAKANEILKKKQQLALELKRQIEFKQQEKDKIKQKEKLEKEKEEMKYNYQRTEQESSSTSKKAAKKKYQNEPSADNPFASNTPTQPVSQTPIQEPPTNTRQAPEMNNPECPPKEEFEAHEFPSASKAPSNQISYNSNIQSSVATPIQQYVSQPIPTQMPVQYSLQANNPIQVAMMPNMGGYQQMPMQIPMQIAFQPMQMPFIPQSQTGYNQIIQDLNIENAKMLLAYQREMDQMKELKNLAHQKVLEAKEQFLNERANALNIQMQQQYSQSTVPEATTTPTINVVIPSPPKQSMPIKQWKDLQEDVSLQVNTNVKLLEDSPNIEESLQASTKLVTMDGNTDNDKYYETYTENEINQNIIPVNKYQEQQHTHSINKQAPNKEPIEIFRPNDIPIAIPSNPMPDAISNTSSNKYAQKQPIAQDILIIDKAESSIQNVDALLQDTISGSKFTSINLNHNKEDEVKDDSEGNAFKCEEISMTLPKYEITDNNVNIGEVSLKKEEKADNQKHLTPLKELKEEEDKYENDFELVDDIPEISTADHKVVQNIKTMIEVVKDNKDDKMPEVKEEISIDESNLFKEKKGEEIKYVDEENKNGEVQKIEFENPELEYNQEPQNIINESKNYGGPKVRDPFKKSETKKKEHSNIKFTNLQDARMNRIKESGNIDLTSIMAKLSEGIATSKMIGNNERPITQDKPTEACIDKSSVFSRTAYNKKEKNAPRYDIE